MPADLHDSIDALRQDVSQQIEPVLQPLLMTKLCDNQEEQKLVAALKVYKIEHVVLCWGGLLMVESLSLILASPSGWRQQVIPTRHFVSCSVRHAHGQACKNLWSPTWDRALCELSATRSPLGVLEQLSLSKDRAFDASQS